MNEYASEKNQTPLKLPTYREAFLDDLHTFEQAGIIAPEILPGVQAVRKLLEE